eukprot:5692934-Prymnesium_polylepis.2
MTGHIGLLKESTVGSGLTLKPPRMTGHVAVSNRRTVSKQSSKTTSCALRLSIASALGAIRPARLACGADRRMRAPTRSLSLSERFGYAKYTGVTNESRST